ncbi:S41 family peptidase [Persicobacter diffluens]|uniref:PDZ domain-containing protein n=1 Tax=Persicobacter diffluens TaxID=981 RepID=A0AAN5ALQ0_9BACT|nr:hypothetical protein PEDI_40410 [Persicobacter diffluens]
MNKSLFFFLLAISICFSCNNTDSNTEVSEINKYIDEVMHDQYLWSEESPVLKDISNYEPEELVKKLKVSQDRFTFIKKSYGADNARMSNDFEIEIGSGIYLGVTTDEQYFAIHVTEGSPAHNAGVRRGDEIVSVNNSSSVSAIEQLYAQEEGLNIDIEIKRNNSINDYTFQIAQIQADYVGPTEIFIKENDPSVKTGYVHYESFKSISEQALRDVFSDFAAKGVNNLILDMRYNGGGLVSTSAILASLIYPEGKAYDIYLKESFNNRYQAQNQTVTFDPQGIQNTFNKIAIIQDQNTASASESIIWCLRPYLGNKLRTFGKTTVGKDVGSFVLTEHGYDFYPIAFRITDKDDQGDYGNGILPDVVVNESLTNILNNPLNSREEYRVEAALAWIEEGEALPAKIRTEGIPLNALDGPYSQEFIERKD